MDKCVARKKATEFRETERREKKKVNKVNQPVRRIMSHRLIFKARIFAFFTFLSQGEKHARYLADFLETTADVKDHRYSYDF